MDLIAEFVKNVMSGDGSFTLTESENPFDTERRYSFVQEKVGKAKFVYRATGYNEDFYASIAKKFELVAIATQEKVYWCDAYFFGVYHGVHLPENVDGLCNFAVSLDECVNSTIFPAFYEALEPVEVSEKNCREKARSALLTLGNPDFYIAEVKPQLFKEQDAVKVLCGLMDMEKEAKLRLEKDREEWCKSKSEKEKIRELMVTPGVCQDWELAIAAGLRSVDAVNVTVTFEMNGKCATGKMEPSVIDNTLIGNGTFCDWNFATATQGEKVIEELGASSNGWGINPLKCQNICKITYGKKVLYERSCE